MDRKSLVVWGILLFFIFIGIAYAWWTPTDSINLRCRYEEMNATNVSICGNLTMGDTCGEGCTRRFMIIPNQSGYIYFWSSGMPFYFNTNVTINGTLITIGPMIVNGSLNMSKFNITDVDWLFVNNVTGDLVWFHTDIAVEYPYNVTANNFIGNVTYQQRDAQYWRNSTGNVVWCKYYNGTHLIEESPCTL